MTDGIDKISKIQNLACESRVIFSPILFLFKKELQQGRFYYVKLIKVLLIQRE
jgi:hypothetical protein